MRLIIATLAALTAFTAHAEDKSNGCGLGWKVTSRHSFSATTTRGTTNSYTTPFGMTSGTAGCAKHTIVKNEQQIRNFVHTSYESLSLDAAIGGGEHLAALTQLLGCSSEARAQVGMRMQLNYNSMFPAHGSGDQLVDDVITMIGNDGQLSQSCKLQTDS